MTRINKVFLLLMIPSLLLSACSPVKQSPASQPTIPTIPEATSQPADMAAKKNTVSFVDDLDRKVTIEFPVKRIVSIAPAVTESLYAIGAGEQVIGRTDFCDYPEEAATLPSIGGFTSDTISIEAIIALEPDVVIGGSIYQSGVIKALEGAGIPIYISQPSSMDEIITSISRMGEITGHTTEAVAVTGKMQTRLDEIKSYVSTLSDDQRPTVFYEIWHEPLMTATDHSVIGQLISLAGGVNVFGEMTDEYPTVSAEQLIEYDPQVIVGPSNHEDQLTAEVIGSRKGWETITAVKNKAIYIVDGNIVSRESPRIIEALDMILIALHPEFKK